MELLIPGTLHFVPHPSQIILWTILHEKTMPVSPLQETARMRPHPAQEHLSGQ